MKKHRDAEEEDESDDEDLMHKKRRTVTDVDNFLFEGEDSASITIQ